MNSFLICHLSTMSHYYKKYNVYLFTAFVQMGLQERDKDQNKVYPKFKQNRLLSF